MKYLLMLLGIVSYILSIVQNYYLVVLITPNWTDFLRIFVGLMGGFILLPGYAFIVNGFVPLTLEVYVIYIAYVLEYRKNR
jgi:hypothetical protein